MFARRLAFKSLLPPGDDYEDGYDGGHDDGHDNGHGDGHGVCDDDGHDNDVDADDGDVLESGKPLF